ncbi:unnamed protein product [Caenorhabditis angaria]|uniref:Uncharacterized protein n=1 Tax=Caenorhabditis angaria TaxID=860376 RepID=A0A9P1IPM1_9PELO|nr:unnamed protein product [Caenorhabditis angaria]
MPLNHNNHPKWPILQPKSLDLPRILEKSHIAVEFGHFTIKTWRNSFKTLTKAGKHTSLKFQGHDFFVFGLNWKNTPVQQIQFFLYYSTNLLGNQASANVLATGNRDNFRISGTFGSLTIGQPWEMRVGDVHSQQTQWKQRPSR